MTAYEQGRSVCEAGMSIHANPYRNTRIDENVHAFSEWEQGWKDAKAEEIE